MSTCHLYWPSILVTDWNVFVQIELFRCVNQGRGREFLRRETLSVRKLQLVGRLLGILHSQRRWIVAVVRQSQTLEACLHLLLHIRCFLVLPFPFLKPECRRLILLRNAPSIFLLQRFGLGHCSALRLHSMPCIIWVLHVRFGLSIDIQQWARCLLIDRLPPRRLVAAHDFIR